ncbi:hypothetical protein ACFL1J_08665 [Pseudomonadota bacterium]
MKSRGNWSWDLSGNIDGCIEMRYQAMGVDVGQFQQVADRLKSLNV